MAQPGSATGPPSSYHTNVNRAKTKKWVEAKSYSYDGDDWGDVDDYDEYGGYDEPEPEPEPTARPTGLRQRGQSASKTPQENYGPRQDLYQSPMDSRQPYGNNAGPPQQQYGERNTIDPQTQQMSEMARTHSFDRGDERRAFASSGQQQHMSNSIPGPYPNRQPQTQNVAPQGMQPGHVYPNQQRQAQQSPPGPQLQIPNRSSMEARGRYGDYPQSAGGSNRGASYSDQQRQQNTGSRAQSMTSNTSALEFHNRRDFSPSAMPPPLQTRGSPSPHGNTDSRSSSRLPPRKSSLTQDNPPNLPFPTQPPSIPPAGDDLSARDRSASNVSNPPALIRPADIYKRMQEEKEKERQSQESSRPNLESILSKSNERPALGKPQDSESNQQRLKPTLDPVTERKSEYGMEGITVNEQTPPGEKRTTTSKKFELPKRAPDAYSEASRSSLGPMLPDVSRMSGFGESFGQSFLGNENDFGESTSAEVLGSASTPLAPPTHEPLQSAPEKDLRNQPSLGFTSAVHQAFDKAEDQVPPTPSSAYASTVERSTSGGTSTVSPIISRGPSTATENWSSKLPGIDDVSTPTIAEGVEETKSRPLSSESLGNPKQIVRKPSPSLATPPPINSPPSSFIPGHRRDLSTPSPDNSPARTPAVESNRQLRQPQEVEMAAATPTDPDFSTDSSSQSSDVVPNEGPAVGQPLDPLYRDSNGHGMDAHPGARNIPGKSDQIISPISARDRTNSSSSSRVRNLADKFESNSRPGSAQSTTPRASMFGTNYAKKDEIAPPRPLADRNESFRPHLPGGWESSASIAPAVALDRLETGPGVQQSDLRKPATSTIDSTKDIRNPIESIAEQQPSSVSQIRDASEEAFSAVAAAGAALAGAFGAVVGTEHKELPIDSTDMTPLTDQESRRKFEDRGPTTRERDVSANTIVHPEASSPSMPVPNDDESSSTAPTPPPETIHPRSAAKLASPDNIPTSPSGDPVSEIRQRPREDYEGGKQATKLPLLSTDLQSHQYESDRLRKEIVRELTPMSASEPTTAETDSSDYNNVSRLSTTPSVRPGYESGVLPREYESYWNDGNSDEEIEQFSREPSQIENATAAESQLGATPISEPLHPTLGKKTAVSETVPEDLSQDRPRMLPNRFSWEKPLENLSQGAAPTQEQPAGVTSMFLKSSIYPEGRSFQPQEEQSAVGQRSGAATSVEPSLNEPPILPEKDSPKATFGVISGFERDQMPDEKELPGYPQGLEVAPSVPEKGFDEPQPSGYPGSFDGTSQRSPLSKGEQGQESSAPLPEPVRQQFIPQNDIPSSPPSATAQPKAPAFREIMALKTANERIRGFDSAREHFTTTDTGLAQWLAITANSLPEHADLLASSGRVAPNVQSHKPSPSRSKLGGFLPSQSASDGTALGAPLGGGSSQGYSPSGGTGGKISSQQVQAKGKDLLHTAGVFGGKANVAAKGLFSKGKNKLRAASGAEKATTPKSEPLSRGMQYEPGLQHARSSPPTPFADIRSVGPQVSLPGSQSLPQSSDRTSPRETPSLESFTPSNEGDDERSEDSIPSNQKLPPRLASLHDVAQKEEDLVQRPVTIGDSAPIFLRETPTADSYVGSPKDILTPRSATSSNKTPTQSNFKESSQSATSQDHLDSIDFQYGTREEIAASKALAPHESSIFPPHSRFSTQLPHDKNAVAPSIRHESEQDRAQMFSEESKDTSHTADSTTEFEDSLLLNQRQPNAQSSEMDRLMSRAPERLNALRQSSVTKPTPLQLSRDAHNGGTTSPGTRSISPMHSPQRTLRPSQDHSLRAPSIDGLPSPVSPYHAPPPVTPTQFTVRERLEQRGREGPIHYGIDHDFIPESDRERARSRSPSYTNPSQPRPSQDSRPSFEPNIDEHPAFRKSEDVEEGSNRRSTSKPRSRRGSRSSAFFKALGKSPNAGPPPLPNAPDSEASSTPITTPTAGEKKRKSISIFRSLTGNSGSGSGSVQSKENVIPTGAIAQPLHTRTEPIAPQRIEDDEFPMRDAQSKWSKRLQRASTSGNTPDSGKKKRFSAIGSLFGRSNQKRQSSSGNTQLPLQQSTPSQRQQPDSYNTTSPLRPLQPERRPPIAEYSPPPPGGYYAPGKPYIDPRVDNFYSPSGSRTQQDRRPSRKSDAPAYVQDASLRQQASPTNKGRKASTARSSAAFSNRSPQHSTSSVPQSSSIRQISSRESQPERSTHESQPSGSSWTRFSTHGRSKSRSSQLPQPPLNGLTSPHPTTYEYAPASTSTERFRRSFHEADRSDSPPPPPPPPKDDWHRPRPRDSSSTSPPQNPSQSSTFPLSSTQNRQSLPPLQTNVPSNRNSAVRSGKTLTPEEKRESRRLEIERSTLSPAAAAAAANSVPGRVREDEEEPVQMSATSFPGQLWQPEYAHWDGE